MHFPAEGESPSMFSYLPHNHQDAGHDDHGGKPVVMTMILILLWDEPKISGTNVGRVRSSWAGVPLDIILKIILGCVIF